MDQRLAGHVEGDEAKEDAEPHQCEGGREPHHDHDHDEAEHLKPKGRITHDCNSEPMPRWRAASSIFCARSMASLRSASSTYSLFANCSSITSISAASFRRSGHSPVCKHATQRMISA